MQLGVGIGSMCDSSKSRYEKIIYAGDEDADGKGITNLVLSVFINMMPDIVKDGRLYILRSPLYTWRDSKGNPCGCMNIKDIPSGIKYSRIKGLGEFDDDEVKKFIMSPIHRMIYRVSYPSDINEFNQILGTSAGKRSLLEDLNLIIDIRNEVK